MNNFKLDMNTFILDDEIFECSNQLDVALNNLVLKMSYCRINDEFMG